MEIKRNSIESLYCYPTIMEALPPKEKEILETLSKVERRCFSKLTNTFSPKQQFRYTDYEDALCEKNQFTHRAAFVHGFQMGARLILEANAL